MPHLSTSRLMGLSRVYRLSCHDINNVQFCQTLRVRMLCPFFIYSLLLAVSPLYARRTSGSSIGKSFGGGVHYPPSNGMSGNTNAYKSGHIYPHSTGLSGNYVGHRGSNYNSKPQVHHHYYYNPPPHITYGASHYPVYQGPPPVYVYEYRNSGSRYDSLLTGLALYNLGRMSAGHHDQNYGREYRGPPGEICKMRIERSDVEYEETRIDCRLISSFILEGSRKPNNVIHTITTGNVNQNGASENSTNKSNTTVISAIVQNTTDALKVKGPSVQLTPMMQCFVIHMTGYTPDLKRRVECDLLQEYARRSMHNGSTRSVPGHVIYVLNIFVVHLILYLYSSRTEFRK